MTTPWAHLPNAIHFDRLVVSIKYNAHLWAGTFNLPEDRNRNVDTAWDTAWHLIQHTYARKIYTDICYFAYSWQGRMAFTALIAYDDCAYMLDSDPGELAILAAFGDPRAILLLPACIALAKEKELTHHGITR